MIDYVSEVNRKKVKKDRIAICPKFGCKYLEKIKPLKFGIFGFRKYPKCPLHELSLVFIDEFIENFIQAVNACLFDISGLPPKTLLKSIMEKAPNEIKNVIKGWIFCNPIGRGAQIVSEYMDGLSRSYIKLLNRKQRKSVQDQETSKKRYDSLRAGLNKVAEEYSSFLQKIHTKSELIDNRECLNLNKSTREVLNRWLKEHLNEIQMSQEKMNQSLQINQLPIIKTIYDKILHAGTCSLLLGKSPAIRLKRFIFMLGFSPFDGYDFLDNIFRDKYNKFRINAHFHHIDYDPKNDMEENLVFLPSKHPNDSKKMIRYMTHDKISGMEATYKDNRTAKQIKNQTRKELSKIKQQLQKNTSIITQVFLSKDSQLLDSLIGWNRQSILKFKNRLEDHSLTWTMDLNKIIPKEKYGKRISNLEYNKLKKKCWVD